MVKKQHQGSGDQVTTATIYRFVHIVNVIVKKYIYMNMNILIYKKKIRKKNRKKNTNNESIGHFGT